MLRSEDNFNPEPKRFRTSNIDDINTNVWQWFVAARFKIIPISGPIVQTQALKVAKELGQSEFKASNGSLDKFRANVTYFRLVNTSS